MVHFQILIVMVQCEDIRQMQKVYIYIYMAHNNCVAVSVGDVSNASIQYFMCDGAVSKIILNIPIDVLGDVYTNGN